MIGAGGIGEETTELPLEVVLLISRRDQCVQSGDATAWLRHHAVIVDQDGAGG